ncbi:MAG: hypothetical protein QF701_13605 [Nitrospinota bacterium]|nr:hypothetical protein [Nitrospinota bacterium]
MYKVDLYARVRYACHVEGKSIREASRVFGLHRSTVRKMLRYAAPPGYQRSRHRSRPKLDPFTGIIDEIIIPDGTLLSRPAGTLLGCPLHRDKTFLSPGLKKSRQHSP